MTFFSNSHSVKLYSVTPFYVIIFLFLGETVLHLIHPRILFVFYLIDYSSLSCSNISIKCTVTANANQTFIVAVVTLYSEINVD